MDQRRRDLRLTWDQVASQAGIHRETLRQIRIGKGDIRPLSATGIEDALQWEHGSIDNILAGREPTTIVEAADRQSLEREYQDPAVAELAQRLQRQEQTTARLAEENNELRRMLKEITGKPSSTSGREEPETDAPRQAM
jgi:transcriptional regulator with XRE-family HTH domain